MTKIRRNPSTTRRRNLRKSRKRMKIRKMKRETLSSNLSTRQLKIL